MAVTRGAQHRHGGQHGAEAAGEQQRLASTAVAFAERRRRELDADRAMLECAGGAQWPAVLSMFTKLAGGAVGEPLDGKAFLQQLSDTQSEIERTIVEAAIAANPHPPLLYRVQELQSFMQS